MAQGAEAGGHRSTFELGPGLEPALVGTIALVPQVIDAVPVPVVASGGIVDGRGLAAALALGAAGAQLGTRFLLAREAGTAPCLPRRARARGRDGHDRHDTVHREAGEEHSQSVRRPPAGVEPLPWPLQRFAAERHLPEASPAETR